MSYLERVVECVGAETREWGIRGGSCHYDVLAAPVQEAQVLVHVASDIWQRCPDPLTHLRSGH